MNTTYYRNLALVLLLHAGFLVHGQPSGNQNYVASRTFLQPLSSVPSSVTISQAMTDVSYLDGLGRPVQKVLVKASPDGLMDVVAPVSYDAFGRQDKSYLPYATASGAGGAFKANSVSAQGTYYNSTAPAGQVSNPKPFSVTVFEASPLNRVLEQGFPGAVWQPSASRTATAGRTVVTERSVNNTTAFGTVASTGQVALYGVSLNASGVPTLTLSGAYGAGQLYVTITKDENWVSGRAGTTEEYKDKQGQVVLKRTFNLIPDNQLEMLSTYFVYDDFGNLTYVLPPGAEPDKASLPTGSTFTTWLADFVYQYRYDGRRRMVERKIPGKGVEYLVYNKLDQLVASQDALQRGKSPQEWAVTKYDGLGRVVLTGLWTSSSTATTREAVQVLADAQTAPNLWEIRDPSSSASLGYTSRAWPVTGLGTTLSVNYYDGYTAPNMPAAFKPAAGQSTMVQGLPTAFLTKVLGTTGAGSMLWSVMHYDNKGQVVKQFSQHYKGGVLSVGNYDETTNVYSFSGQLTSSTRKHYTGSTSGSLAMTALTEHSYDHRNRLVDTRKKIDAGAMYIVSRNEYNQVGQLRSKKLHSSNSGTTFAQTISYAYNPRGWLKESDAPLFKQSLKYEDITTGVVSQYNGNISQQLWTHSGIAQQKYTYTYDKLNRLTEGTMVNSIGRETLKYDKMGNIVKLSRTGTSSTLRDTLSYMYSGNRLTQVVDGSSDGSLQFHLSGTTNYTHDLNGNMKTRLNTAQPGNNITAISYNHLSLPVSITATGGSATYVYDATGRKLRSTQSGITTDYIEGIEWEGASLNLLHMEEGRIIKSGANYIYEYLLKDHLGNNRSGFKHTATTVASFRSDYYPFGLQYQQDIVVGSPENKYLYNGKELQQGTGMLDYGARQYDPVIGRWNVVDPLAENYRSLSSYNYTDNNPVNNTDPDGMAIFYGFGSITYIGDAAASGLLKDRPEDGGDNVDDDNEKRKKKKATQAEANKGGGEKDGWLGKAAGIALTTASADGPLPIGDAIGAVVVAGAAVHDLSQIKYVTYTLTNAKGQVYVGRSSGYGDPYSIMNNRFSGHHMKALGYGNPQLDRVAQGYPVGYYAIRGREQDVINGYGGIGSPKLGNTRNGIWEYNPNRPLYMGASKLMFGPYVR